MSISRREQFMAMVDNDTIMKADAIVLLQGDGHNRVTKTYELWEAGYAPIVVISGGAFNEAYGSFDCDGLRNKLMEFGVPADRIVVECLSENTYEQGKQVVKLAVESGWSTLILVASHYHQYRAYLTFLQAMKEGGKKLHIINIPARNLSWFRKEPWGQRLELLEEEFKKIERYGKQGHVVSFDEAIEYQKQKELRTYPSRKIEKVKDAI